MLLILSYITPVTHSRSVKSYTWLCFLQGLIMLLISKKEIPNTQKYFMQHNVVLLSNNHSTLPHDCLGSTLILTGEIIARHFKFLMYYCGKYIHCIISFLSLEIFPVRQIQFLCILQASEFKVVKRDYRICSH